MAPVALPENAAALMEQLRAECEPLGVHDKLVKGGEAGLTEVTLRRWLAARSWEVPAALRDLSKHAEWRAETVPSGRVLEDQVKAEVAQDKVFIPGCDKEGHAVVITLVDRHVSTTLETTKLFITYCLDAGCRMSEANGQSTVIGILDLEAMTMRNYDFNSLRAIFDLLQNHFVERLHRLYLYCAPVIFYGLWKLVCPFIDPVTKAKVVFVSREQALTEFSTTIDPQVLPERYSGKGAMRPITQVWQDLLAAEAPAAASGKAAAEATDPKAAAGEEDTAAAAAAAEPAPAQVEVRA